MEQKHILTTNQIASTNSLIRLPIPQTNNNSKYQVKWIKQQPESYNSEFKSIFMRQDIRKNTTLEYQCNPLDYGAVITGQVIVTQDGNQQMAAETKFGPVELEDQIGKYFNTPGRFDVQIVVNKTSLLSGRIRFSNCPFVINNHYKASIILIAENFEFQLKIEKGIMMPPNSPFFRFYPNQENSVGVSIFHQHPQLMEKLKSINVFVHIGYYLKFYFQNQKFRDIFLIQIMQYFGIIQYDKTQKLQSPSIRINVVPQLDKSSFGSQISAKDKKNNQEQKSKDVDDEIYKLLYEKSQQEQPEEKDVELSFENAAAFLLSSIRKSGINKLTNISFNKDRSENKSVRQPKPLSQNKSNFILDKSSNFRESADQFQSLAQKWSVENRKSLHLSPPKNKKNILKSHENLNHESQLRNTITKLTLQIDSLLKQNRKLSQQNKKLKQQNMKWRFKEIKKTFKHAVKQKALNSSKITRENMRTINVYKPVPSAPPSKVSSYKFLSKDKVGKSNNLLMVSKTTVPRENTIESPGSNGLSEPTMYQRKKNELNFTSCISVLNKQFVEEQPSKKGKKFIPRKRKIINLNRSTNSKNSKSQINKSFDKPEETPSTPFFTSMNLREALHMKTHESLFFRQYFNEQKLGSQKIDKQSL